MMKLVRLRVFIIFLVWIHLTCLVPNWSYEKEGSDWGDKCRSQFEAPIDISAPYLYKKLSISFFYSKMMTEYSFYNNGNNLILEGDFGYVTYKNSTYFTSDILFFAPSVHTIANKTLPLEMQVQHHDDKGNKLVVSVFFRTSNDYSMLLGQLGFDKESLKEMRPFIINTISEQIDLSKYISNKKDFFYYSGKEMSPPCKAKTNYFILTDIYQISKDQLKNFPDLVYNKKRKIQKKYGRKVYSSFDLNEAHKKREKMKKKIDKIKKIKNLKRKIKYAKNKIKGSEPNVEKKKEDKNTDEKKTKKKLNKKKQTDKKKSSDKSKKDKQIDKKKKAGDKPKKNKKIDKKKINKDKKKKEKSAKKPEKNKKTDKSVKKSNDKSQKSTKKTKLTKKEKKLLEKKIRLRNLRKMRRKNQRSIKKKKTKKSKHLNPVEEDTCVEITPMKKVLQKVNSIEKYKRFTQPFIISPTSNSTMKININLPKSDAEILSLSLDAKQKYLEKLYKKSVVSPDDPFIFVQIKKLETIINEVDSKEATQYSSFFVLDDQILEVDNLENAQNFIQKDDKTKSNKKVDEKKTQKTKKDKKKELKKKKTVIKKTTEPSKTKQKTTSTKEKNIKSINKDKIKTKAKSKTNNKKVKNSSESKKNKIIEKELKKLKKSFRSPKILSKQDWENKNIENSINHVNKLISHQRNRVDEVNDLLDGRKRYYDDLKDLLDETKRNSEKIKEFKKIKTNPVKIVGREINKIENKISKIDKLVKSEMGPLKNLRKTLKIKKKLNSLNQNCIIKKITQKDLERTFNKNKKYNIMIYNMIRLIIPRLSKKFYEMDKINQDGCEFNFLNKQGYIRFSHKNLSEIIKKAFEIVSKETKLKQKLDELFEFSQKIIFLQHRSLQTQPSNDVRKIKNKDINKILNEVIVPDELNKQKFKKLQYPRIKNLISQILKKLPIVLLSKSIYKKKILSHNGILEDNIINESSVIIDNTNINLPIIKKRPYKKLVVRRIGEGRKAKNSKGKIDQTEIFDISTWPMSCKTNINQSPINIIPDYDPEVLPLNINYREPKGKMQYLNDGFKLILRANLGTITYGKHQYSAKEIHFHYPSEHTFGENETRSVLEMQIIHQDLFGNLAGLIILFDTSLNENKFLSELGFGINRPSIAMKLRNAEIVELYPNNEFDLSADLNSSHYVSYIGSITTPPCNRNVQWFILLNKLQVSQKQLEYFPVLFGKQSNVRGLQERGNRSVKIV